MGLISSKQEYLHWLGKYLLLFFPVKQVLEVLSDYQEYVSQEKESMENMVKQWGTPRHVLRALLEENPQAKRYFYKWSAFWGLAMVLSLVVCRAGHYLSLVLIPVFVFGFLHGQGQIMVEDYLLIKTDSPKSLFAIYLFLTAVVVLLEAEIQYLLRNVERIPNHMGGIPIGLAIDREYAFFQLIILLLIVWMIKRAVTVSIQYLLDVVYAMGVMLFIADVRNCLHSMEILMTEEVIREFLFPVIYCGIGMGMAVVLKIFAKLVERRGLWTHR